MLVYRSPYFFLCRFLDVLHVFLVGAVGVMALVPLVYSGNFRGVFEEVGARPPRVESKKQEGEKNLYAQLGSGPLRLNGELSSFPLPNLKEEIIFFGKNSRPDQNSETMMMAIALGGGERLLAKPGQPLFLNYKESGGALQFVKETSPLFIRPFFDQEGKARAELGICLLNERGEKVLEEKEVFFLEALREVGEGFDPTFEKGIARFKQAVWWPPDQLFEKYGGEENAQVGGCQRLDFGEHPLTFLKEGDTLIWSGKNWMKVPLGTESASYPLARVVALSPQRMDVELWDRYGIEKDRLSLFPEKARPSTVRSDSIFTHLKQRTSSKVSCRLGNKTRILKRGDWFLKTQTGWRIIRTWKEMKDILDFDLLGELFIFDGIEKEGAAPYFVGTLFDEKRVQPREIRLPFEQKKRRAQSSRKKGG